MDNNSAQQLWHRFVALNPNWRDVHEQFFTEEQLHNINGEFDSKMAVVCESFQLVYRSDQP